MTGAKWFYKENNDNLIFQTILEDINTKSKVKNVRNYSMF